MELNKVLGHWNLSIMKLGQQKLIVYDLKWEICDFDSKL